MAGYHKIINPFAEEGSWFKANLHAHTTESDGRFEPVRVKDWYRAYGYQVLAVTDHWKITDVTELQHEDFLALTGVEFHAGRTVLGRDYHVVALDIFDLEGFHREMTLDQCLKLINDKGGLGFVAHPYWSALTTADLEGVEGSIGIEVFNTGCELEIAKGVSVVHWDDILIRGERALGIAVDDGHKCGWDFCGGWTMIKAPKLDRESVVAAVGRGSFYSSTGPVIHNLEVEGDRVYIECSPAARVRFICNHQQGWCIQKGARPPLTAAEYRLNGKESYLRIEVVDETGLTAWTQPFYFPGA